MIGMFLRLMTRGVKDMAHHPLAQVLTLTAVTMVAFLGGMFMLLLHNLETHIVKTQGKVQFQIYWQAEADMDQVEGQWRELAKQPHLREIQTYTPDQGLDAMSETLGSGADLSWLKGQSPIPATALLYFDVPRGQEDWARQMLAHLEGLPGVAKVHFNPFQVDLARSWLAVSKQVVWPIIVFLGLVMALVVGNTIKLSMLTKREEVEILNLVGASRFYIRMPLLVGGVVQGLAGSLLALGMLKALQLSVRNVLNFPPLNLEVRFLPFEQVLILVGALTLVGLAGSYVAVRN